MVTSRLADRVRDLPDHVHIPPLAKVRHAFDNFFHALRCYDSSRDPPKSRGPLDPSASAGALLFATPVNATDPMTYFDVADDTIAGNPTSIRH